MRDFRSMPSQNQAGTPVAVQPGAQPTSILAHGPHGAQLRGVAWIKTGPVDRGTRPHRLRKAGHV